MGYPATLTPAPRRRWDSSLSRNLPAQIPARSSPLTTALTTDRVNLRFFVCSAIMVENQISGCSAVGSTRHLGCRGRAFESRHSDQKPSGADAPEGFLLNLLPQIGHSASSWSICKMSASLGLPMSTNPFKIRGISKFLLCRLIHFAK